MKYEAPKLEKTIIETKDIITASKDYTVIERDENGSLGADYKIDFSKLFGTI